MTIEQFNSTKWCAGMKVHCNPMGVKYEPFVDDVVSVNLDQALIAVAMGPIDDAEQWMWFRCENCEIVTE